jgi:hypothetical protein
MIDFQRGVRTHDHEDDGPANHEDGLHEVGPDDRGQAAGDAEKSGENELGANVMVMRYFFKMSKSKLSKSSC